MDLLTVAIGIGLAVSLLFSELFGLAAGGMVVPGYVALSLNRPVDVLLTLLAALITYLLVHALSTVVIMYGKRRTVLMILVGYLVGVLIRMFPISPVETFETMEAVEQLKAIEASEFSVIGYIIPGLLAIWMDRQGLVETIAILMTASATVRLVLILCGIEGLS